MSAAGAFVVWTGGWPFAIAASLLCGLMIWEATNMFGAPTAIRAGCVAAVAILIAGVAPWFVVLPVLVAAVLICTHDVAKDKVLFFSLGVWVLLGCFAAIALRENAGFVWLLWLVLVVMASDIAGYFAGRSFGGPKFWPSISPKKTWSGTIAGWLGAAIVGLVFAGPTGAGIALVPVSVLIGFSGQLGDIAESAVKRRMQVKDSSNLIPGHGGVFDRFDAFLGASAMTFLLWMINLLPGLS